MAAVRFCAFVSSGATRRSRIGGHWRQLRDARTNDGRTIVAEGKPVVDNDTGLIRYKDANGVKQQINRADVKEMVELNQ